VATFNAEAEAYKSFYKSCLKSKGYDSVRVMAKRSETEEKM
jgi:hypothetical protein